MSISKENCDICNGTADTEFKRVEVWTNKNWRLTASTYSSVKGLCYLEPRRHITYITELDGEESVEFGTILSKTTKAIKEIFNAKLVYVYIFGGHIPHLHVHLAPHTEDDIFFGNIVKDESLVSEELLNQSDMQNLKHIFEQKLN